MVKVEAFVKWREQPVVSRRLVSLKKNVLAVPEELSVLASSYVVSAILVVNLKIVRVVLEGCSVLVNSVATDPHV